MNNYLSSILGKLGIEQPNYVNKLQAALSPMYQGMIQQGNIDLMNRPVVKNKDGSISTVRSIGIEMDGKHFLIPTVSDQGKLLNNKEAFKLFRDTGKHLGIFHSQEAATNYAKQLHNDQANIYASQGASQ